MKKFAWLTFTCALFAAIAQPANAIIMGTTGGGGYCNPFGCASTTRYQQVYDANSFSSTINITDIEFYRTAIPGGNLNSGTYSFYLSTTTADINDLSTNLDNNLGTDNTLFAVEIFTGGLAPSTITIFGSSFTYDPTQGNLLLDILISDLAHSGQSAYYDSSGPNRPYSRAFDYYSELMSDGGGMVTGFNEAPLPEPQTLSLISLGLLGIYGASRRRKCT